MSLDPSPLASQPTALLPPTDPVPHRGAAAIGGILASLVAIIVVIVSLRLGTEILFGPAGLRAQSNAIVASSPYQIQGFDYYWRKGLTVPTGTSGGYDSTAVATKVANDEATNYHMNSAVVTITLDQLKCDAASIRPDNNMLIQTNGPDTYSDDVYTAMAHAIAAAGMTPIFRIQIRITKDSNSNPSPACIGNSWEISASSGQGLQVGILVKEHAWFDNYTDVVVHYAQLAQKDGVPFFIFGSNLSAITIDTSATMKSTDTYAKPWPGDTYICNGRRECGWRHVIAAIRGTTYQHATGKGSFTGGGYTGKLIYEAAAPSQGNSTGYEWQSITWWDAVDIIGIDADYPILATSKALSAQMIADAWKGVGAEIAPDNASPGGLLAQFETLSTQFNKPVLFLQVGYCSFSNANNQPPGTAPSGTTTLVDQQEQRFDMQGLLIAFSDQPWWLGVIWSADYPLLPRSGITENTVSLDTYSWQYDTQWAGDCLTSAQCPNPEKSAGRMLRDTYKVNPLPPLQTLMPAAG